MINPPLSDSVQNDDIGARSRVKIPKNSLPSRPPLVVKVIIVTDFSTDVKQNIEGVYASNFDVRGMIDGLGYFGPRIGDVLGRTKTVSGVAAKETFQFLRTSGAFSGPLAEPSR
jgi:hypothetical protein